MQGTRVPFRCAIVLSCLVGGALCVCNNAEDYWVECPPPGANVAYDTEDAALRALYNSTDGPHWKENAGWLNASLGHCEWWGVNCDASGTVTAL